MKNNQNATLRLETDRLVLRPLTPDDAQTMFDTWTSDPEVTKYLRWSTHESVEETKKWLVDKDKSNDESESYVWGIEIKDTRRLIGSIGVVHEDDEPGRAEVGYCIGKAYWSQGYTTAALKCMIQYLSNEVGIKHFAAKHAVENPASGAVMRHAGFRYVGDGTAESFDGKRKFNNRIYYLDLE